MMPIDFATKVAVQLDERVRDLYQRARIMFGRAPAGVSIAYVVHDLATRLSDIEHGTVSQTAAREAAGALVPDLDSEDFWRSALGQLIAWHIGYPQDWVPVKLVGALLGTSRQYGYQAVNEAQLQKVANGGSLHVETAGVLDLIRDRRPHPWKVK